MSKKRENGLYDVSVFKTLSEEELRPETVFGCVLTIPGTDYSIKEETMYFPGKGTKMNNIMNGMNNKMSFILCEKGTLNNYYKVMLELFSVAYQVKAGSPSSFGTSATCGIMLTMYLMVVLSSMLIPRLSSNGDIIQYPNHFYTRQQVLEGRR